MKTKLTDFRATAKAWVAAAASVVTSIAAYIVPDTSLGRFLAALAAALVTLGAVFGVENKGVPPTTRDVSANNPYQY